MSSHFRAVALDLDGTIASDGAVREGALAAVRAARAAGIRVLLVTGRILAELDHEHPGLAPEFDAVVAENGAVLRVGGDVTDLAPPVDDALRRALADGGVAARRGRVLLACHGRDDEAVHREIQRLGLDCQLLRNRSELMVLPAAVSKGTGLRAALAEFGLSVHNAVAFGDAENDIALLETAEVGVAVADAVPSLKQHADVVLDLPDGRGVADFLGGPVLRGAELVWPQRRRIAVGEFADGGTAGVPGAQANILVCGESGTGKSFVTGLLAERWMAAGYSLLVVDVEGDHIGLGRHRSAVVFGRSTLPRADELVALFRGTAGSVVLDMSGLDPAALAAYGRSLEPLLGAERAAYGRPHWVLLDEAHVGLSESGAIAHFFRPTDRGFCLATYRPEDLTETALATIDVTIRLHRNAIRRATIRERGGPEQEFYVAPRRTPHRRHWHKYVTEQLPRQRWFGFRDPGDGLAGAAGNLAQFAELLRTVRPEVAQYHLARGDYSRWLGGTVADQSLAQLAGALEQDFLARRALDVERAREELASAVEERYGLQADGPP